MCKLILPKLNDNENGFSLIELIVAIIIMGVALPAIFSLYASLSANSQRSATMDHMVEHAQNRMEEIIAQKEADTFWYKTPGQFDGTENLTDGYQRTVSSSAISNWGNASLSGWEITVQVSNPRVTNPYTISVRFTQYHE